MKATLLALHAVIVMAVLGFCVWEGWRAIEFYGNEYRALTYQRSALAILCGSYALAHVVLLFRKRVTTQALLWFYPLCFSLGISAAFVSHAYGKGWAPADASEAFNASVVGFGIVGLLWFASAFSCYRAFMSPGGHGAQPTVQADGPAFGGHAA